MLFYAKIPQYFAAIRCKINVFFSSPMRLLNCRQIEDFLLYKVVLVLYIANVRAKNHLKHFFKSSMRRKISNAYFSHTEIRLLNISLLNIELSTENAD